MSASESKSGIVLELAEEFLERYRQGQRPSLKEYIDRHPELAAEIKEVFPAMALMENVALADESLAGAATGPATPAEATPPQQLGDYRILREVGRGGMGIVYEAEQVSLGRHVALKVLPRQMFVDDSQRRRFEREAKAAAKLHHTNIVPVFGVGENEGMPYYVMQFIQGLGLDEVMEELKRMQGSGPATATGGQLRVSRKDVSAADVARSLMTGAYQKGEPAANAAEWSNPAANAAEWSNPAANAAGSPESSVSGKLSDSFTLSSSVRLPGSDGAMQGKSKKATYWQSVAQIGMQVAEALEYAHKQGIQHRDIKPSNLLLDTHGTVWVTDFGLARAESEDHLTQTGDIVGTLRYMPPEAFEGRADKRGDIYSLGLTLYELLALKPAYDERERHRLIKRVTTEEPVALDKLTRSIPHDLVTIVHKSIDREPSHRYPAAGELAADLQRFLDDEPIQARRVSNGERLLRWGRHHPGVAALTATLAVILLAVTVASLVAAARFDRAATNERTARAEAEEAKGQAESNLQEAEKAKKLAESNFATARKAVDEYFTKVSESQLLQVPGMQPLRRELLQSALKFYQDFLQERGDEPALRGELAAAYLRLGTIRMELFESDEAVKAWSKAGELYELLTKSEPDSVEWRHGLAQSYYRLRHYEEAIAVWQKLVQPGQQQFQKELAKAYTARGFYHSRAGRSAEALEAYQQSLAIREMLVRLNPDDPEAQNDLGISLSGIASILDNKGRSADALVMYRRAGEYHEAAFTRAPQVLLNGYRLASSQFFIATIENRLGHTNEALVAYRQVVETYRRMVRDNPAVLSLHKPLLRAYWRLAQCQRNLKQTEQAKETARLAHEAIERVPSDGPDALFHVACIRADYAAFIAEEEGNRTAQEQAEQKQEADLAIETLRKAIAAGFRDAERFKKEMDLNALRGREDFKALEADLAARAAAAPTDKLTANQQALDLRQRIAQADPKNKRLQANLAASQHAIALVQLDLGKVEEAQQHLDQALALREALVKDEPKDEQYQADVAASRLYVNLARARRFAEQKRKTEAEAALAQIAVFPPNDAQAHKERGRTYFALGQIDKATAEFRKAVGLSDDETLEMLALPSEPATSETDKLFAQLADDAFLRKLTAAVERSPGDMGLRWKRAYWHACHARWKEAAADWRTSLQQRPTDNALDWLHVAPALAAGDGASYRWLCREMLKRFGETQDPTTADRVAKACMLLPEFAKEMERAFQLAELAAVRGKNHLYTPYFIFCKGLADYRRGNFRAAIEGLDAPLSKAAITGPYLIANYHLVLAMAFHHQGDERVARDHLMRGANLLNEYLLDPVRFPIPRNARYHQDWLIPWLLHREAKELIEGNKAEPKK